MATAPIKTIESIRSWVYRLFDFTDTSLLSAITVKKAGAKATNVDVMLTASDQDPSRLDRLSFGQEFDAAVPIARGSHVRAYKEGDEIKRILPDYLFQATPERPVAELLSQVYEEVEKLKAAIKEMKVKATDVKEKKAPKSPQKLDPDVS